MKKRYFSRIIVVVIALVLALGAMPMVTGCAKEAALPGPELPTKKEPILLGYVPALAVPAAAVCQTEIFHGVEDYVRWVNDQGGIDGREVKLLWESVDISPNTTRGAYLRLKEMGALAVIMGCTSCTVGLNPTFVESKVLVMNLAIADILMYPPTGWHYAEHPTYTEAFCGWVDWVLQNWKGTELPRFAWLTIDNPFGLAPVEIGNKYLKTKGIKPVATVLTPYSPVDMTAELGVLMKANPDVVFSNVSDTLIIYAKNVYKEGLVGKFLWGGPYISDSYLEAAGAKSLEGFVCPNTYSIFAEEDVPGIKMIKDMQMKYHHKIISTSMFYVGGVSCASVPLEAIRLAIKEKGWPVTPVDVKNALDNMKDFKNYGLTGSVSFAPDNMIGSRYIKNLKVEGGKIVPVTGWIKCPKMDPAEWK